VPRLTSRLVPAAAVLILATGCAAGQIAQTSTQQSTTGGVSANVGEIALRDISLEYPEAGVWSTGDDVRLQFVAVNRSAGVDDALVDVTSPAFGGEVDSEATLPIELAAGVDTSFQGDGEVLELTSLGEELVPTVRVEVTFTFEQAGAVRVMVPVAVPLEHLERTDEPYDFHVEEDAAPTEG